MSTLLEMRIDELEEQNAALKAERDALAAQVEALQSTAAKVVTGDAEIAELEPLLDATPQQHLAEIRAEAGRAGFVAGFKLGTQTPKPTPENCHPASMVDFVAYQVEKFANIKAHEYANSIRRGEVK